MCVCSSKFILIGFPPKGTTVMWSRMWSTLRTVPPIKLTGPFGSGGASRNGSPFSSSAADDGLTVVGAGAEVLAEGGAGVEACGRLEPDASGFRSPAWPATGGLVDDPAWPGALPLAGDCCAAAKLERSRETIRSEERVMVHTNKWGLRRTPRRRFVGCKLPELLLCSGFRKWRPSAIPKLLYWMGFLEEERE